VCFEEIILRSKKRYGLYICVREFSLVRATSMVFFGGGELGKCGWG